MGVGELLSGACTAANCSAWVIDGGELAERLAAPAGVALVVDCVLQSVADETGAGRGAGGCGHLEQMKG